MFGFKIIKKREYDILLRAEKEADEMVQHVVADKKKVENDCASLRQQLNDKMKEVKKLTQFKKDTMEAMANIDLAGFHLTISSNKCTGCDHESPDCRKYEFGKHTFCLCRN